MGFCNNAAVAANGDDLVLRLLHRPPASRSGRRDFVKDTRTGRLLCRRAPTAPSRCTSPGSGLRQRRRPGRRRVVRGGRRVRPRRDPRTPLAHRRACRTQRPAVRRPARDTPTTSRSAATAWSGSTSPRPTDPRGGGAAHVRPRAVRACGHPDPGAAAARRRSRPSGWSGLRRHGPRRPRRRRRPHRPPHGHRGPGARRPSLARQPAEPAVAVLEGAARRGPECPGWSRPPRGPGAEGRPSTGPLTALQPPRRAPGPADLRGLDDAQLAELAAEIRDALIATCAPRGRPPRPEPRRGRADPRAAPGLRLPARPDRLRHRPPGLRAQDADRPRRAVRHAAAARAACRATPAGPSPPHDVVENSHASTVAVLGRRPGQGLRPPRRGPARRRRDRRRRADRRDGLGGAEQHRRRPGDADRRLVIVVNDNGRSYTPTVGGLANHLTALRTSPRYEQVLDPVKRRLNGVPRRRPGRLRRAARDEEGHEGRPRAPGPLRGPRA